MRFTPSVLALVLSVGSAWALLRSPHDAPDVTFGTLWIVFSLSAAGLLVSLVHLGSTRLHPLRRRWLRLGSLLGVLPTGFYWLRLIPGPDAVTEWPARIVATTLGLPGYLTPQIWDKNFTLFHEHMSVSAMLRSWCVFTGLNVVVWGVVGLGLALSWEKKRLR